MEYLVYIATSPSNKVYVGITNNFKRRMKEHGTSKYPFGRALRKYGRESLTFEFIQCDDLDQAYRIESELVGIDEVKNRDYYNVSPGGRPGIQIGLSNPMKDPEVVKNHPGIFTTENNPMNDPIIRANASRVHDFEKKRVSICGVEYLGVRVAGRILGQSRQMLGHRLKSPRWPDHYYIKESQC